MVLSWNRSITFAGVPDVGEDPVRPPDLAEFALALIGATP